MTKNRLEAFSDGVFAVAITLLILDVRFPAGNPLTLETLWSVAPHVFAFVPSFVIVGVYWVSHHNMLQFIKQVDRQLLWLNLTLLLVIVLIPFPAGLLGQHSDSEFAVMLYGINLMLVNRPAPPCGSMRCHSHTSRLMASRLPCRASSQNSIRRRFSCTD